LVNLVAFFGSFTAIFSFTFIFSFADMYKYTLLSYINVCNND
jgi:hypothetical protein